MLSLSLLVCGIVGGVYLVCEHPAWSYLRTAPMTQGFTESTSSKTLLDVFLNAFLWTGYTLVLTYLCGYSAIGHPISLLLLLVRGVALGVSASTTYVDYGYRGVLVLVSMVLLHAVVSTMVLVSATVSSLRQSTSIAYTLMGRSSEPSSIRRYSLRFLRYTGVVLASSLVDTALTYLLTDRVLLAD